MMREDNRNSYHLLPSWSKSLEMNFQRGIPKAIWSSPKHRRYLPRKISSTPPSLSSWLTSLGIPSISPFLSGTVSLSASHPKEIPGNSQHISWWWWQNYRLFDLTVDTVEYVQIKRPEMIEFHWFLLFVIIFSCFLLVFHCFPLFFLGIPLLNRPSA